MEKKQKLTDIIERYAPLILAIAIVYIPLSLLGIGCPIKFLTGISCAGCGMTRAWLCLLQLDFRGAFYYHPLFFLPPFLVLLFLFRGRMKKMIFRFLLFTVIALFVIVYLYRLVILRDGVVTISPHESIIMRIILLHRR